MQVMVAREDAKMMAEQQPQYSQGYRHKQHIVLHQ